MLNTFFLSLLNFKIYFTLLSTKIGDYINLFIILKVNISDSICEYSFAQHYVLNSCPENVSSSNRGTETIPCVC